MIPLMKHAFINEYETKKALSEFIIKTPKLSMDIECSKFENKFSKFQKRTESILFNSGGSANLALLQSLKNLGKLKEGDRIGFSALTWSTNVMPILQMGFIPIPVDCEVDTLNIMSKNLLDRLDDTSLDALFITNVLGFTGDLDVIKEICDLKKIILLEDNCESLGTELSSRKAGNFGIASTFSFFVAHHMSTIEGGMVCTDDTGLAEMLRIVRANGWDRNLSSKQQFVWRQKYNITSEFEAKYTFYDLGFNMRPTEITGFLGQFQMKFLEENISRRESNFFTLEEVVNNNPELILLNHSHLKRLSSFAFPIIVRKGELKQKYFNQFSGAGVEIRPMIAGNMQRQPFYKKYVEKVYNLPNTDFIHDNGFYCGNYPELSSVDLETLINCLKNYK